LNKIEHKRTIILCKSHNSSSLSGLSLGMAIHIGKKIKEELYKQGITVSAFAKKINRSRNVVYDIFDRESIDTALLNKIGIILRLDFFSIYSEQKEYKKEGIQSLYVKDEKPLYNTVSDQMKALEKQNELLLSEISYLKKIVDLMEEKNKKKGVVKRSKK
jgi:transcriptional regulator with XRE-family HTH domain